jgi:large subunit ribosomal protein L6
VVRFYFLFVEMAFVIEKISVPQNVFVRVEKNILIFSTVGGSLPVKLGSLASIVFCEDNNIIIKTPAGVVSFSRQNFRILSPLIQTLKKKIDQSIFGLSVGFGSQVELVGVGYKVELLRPRELLLKLGFSHDVWVKIPEQITVFCPKEKKETILLMKSQSKEFLGAFLSQVQKQKKPDIYKNKGIILKGVSLAKKKFKKK